MYFSWIQTKQYYFRVNQEIEEETKKQERERREEEDREMRQRDGKRSEYEMKRSKR